MGFLNHSTKAQLGPGIVATKLLDLVEYSMKEEEDQ